MLNFLSRIKGKLNVYSTPNRLIVYIDKITKQISKKSEEIRGPNVNSPDKALEGFLRSNNINKSRNFTKKTQKGEKTWVFRRSYSHFPELLGWGNFKPNEKFYLKTQI